MYPEQKIHESKLVDNLFWTYSEKECEEIKGEGFHRNIEDFVNQHLKNWLPSDYIIFDPLIQGSFSKFIKEQINPKELTYIHFNNGALYMRNSDKNYIVNVKTMWLVEENYKETLTDIINDMNCMVYSYDGIEEYVNLDRIGNVRALDIIRWIKFRVETPIKYFQIVPNIDISKYVPFLMSKVPISSLRLDEDEELYFDRMCVRDKVTRWMSTRYVSFSYDFKKNLNFIYRENAKLARINYSDKRTLTGRITSSDRYNPQNLSKSNSDRTMIVSRFRNGRVYQFDYTSFEARIALYLSGDQEFIQDYYDRDLHTESAKIIYEKLDFTPEERALAKDVNHAILYGAGDITVLKKLEYIPYPQEKMLEVKRFISPLIKKSKELMEEAERNGYLINKWGSMIYPEKTYAGFNNYIQSTASEIIVDKLIELKVMLRGMRSQFMFQVHDSIVMDIHPDELHLVQEIAKMLSYNRGMAFIVGYKSGVNYKDLYDENVYF